jgi:PAS domain S-box-containing protein
VSARSPVDEQSAISGWGVVDWVLAVSTGISCTFDGAGCIRHASPAAAELFGAPPAEIVGHPLCPEEGPSPFADLDLLRQEVQRTGNVLRCMVTGARPPGAARYACVLSPVRAAGHDEGPVEGVVCTFEEAPVTVTAVAESAGSVIDRFSPVFAHAPIGMGVTSLDGTWLEVNQALCALTGRDRETLRTMTVQDVTTPGDRHADFVYLRQLLTGELTGYQLEKRWHRSDGGEVWVLLAVSLVRRSDGEPGHLVVQAQDITVRKEAEGRASLLADLVECSADAIWARDGGGEVVYWNRAAAQLLGYEAADVIGQSALDHLPENRIAETAKVLAIAAGGRSVGPLDTVRRHKDGRDIDVSVTVSPIHGADGTLLGFASVARDVTDRLRGEAELRAAHDELQSRTVALERANAELHRSNEDLQQFAYAASHDLSEPLRAITGFTQLLAQSYRGRLDEEADVFIEFITDGTVRMRQLLDGLLLYSRLNSRPVAPGPVALGEVVDEVLDGLQLRIAESEATIEVDSLPEVQGDRAQLVQLIHHLVANALIYRSPATAPVIRITGEEQADHHVVHVDDAGIGIEARHRERIFRMFARLHGHGDYEGTGIGLALVGRIMDRHRGTVVADDSPLGGTRFTVTFPRPPMPGDGAPE